MHRHRWFDLALNASLHKAVLSGLLFHIQFAHRYNMLIMQRVIMYYVAGREAHTLTS